MHQEPRYLNQEEYLNRKKKLEEIRGLGVEPYPHQFAKSLPLKKANKALKNQASFDEAKEGVSPEVRVAGRLVLMRAMGKNIFATIQHDGERLQLLFNRDLTKVVGYEAKDEGPTHHKFIEKKLDLGDYIGVDGHLFYTQKGELTLFCKKLELLSKALLPLADKHAGLKDKESRYRKRWVDLISNPEVLETFKMRSRILHLIREFMVAQDFLEVEIPVLERLYGGAQAAPFETHLNSLHMDMYMRIALELPLKKLIVGGMDRIFEIGKLFRNEGIDATHNPEFTSIECYAAFWDYHDVMDFTEAFYRYVSQHLLGTMLLEDRIDRKGDKHTIDLGKPFVRMTMKASIKKYGKIDVDTLKDDEMRKILVDQCHMPADKVALLPRGLLISNLFEELVEEHLIEPHMITDHPIETTPLCKLHREVQERKEGLVERFEMFMLGMEMCNAYSELNDPIKQRELLEEQQKQLTAGDDTASPMDEEFLESVYQGMPPCGGIGIGIDRFVMLFTNQHSIRDVILFPLMKPEVAPVSAQPVVVK
jgi:lysyl-tRNA synthetase, class II